MTCTIVAESLLGLKLRQTRETARAAVETANLWIANRYINVAVIDPSGKSHQGKAAIRGLISIVEDEARGQGPDRSTN